LVRSLGFEEVAVVGHDMGAMTAHAYAREHRKETSHLVLMSAATTSTRSSPKSWTACIS
jgi:pimeloyl-ACP methyl ester carboxylesterase